MKNQVISPESFMKFFQETTGVKFVDAETGEPVLEILAKKKKSISSGSEDYDKWLEEQDESVKEEHKMEAL